MVEMHVKYYVLKNGYVLRCIISFTRETMYKKLGKLHIVLKTLQWVLNSQMGTFYKNFSY